MSVAITTGVFDKLKDAFTSKKFDVYVMEGGSRCFAPNTKVRMYSGKLKRVQDISIGDKIMNMHGNGFNTVVSVHSGVDEMFEVKQARGISYTVNSKHILSLKQTRGHERKVAIEGYKSSEKRKHIRLPYDEAKIHDVPVGDYIKKSKRHIRCYTGFKNTMVELPYKSVSIDPYYLGLWLGDGSSARPHEISNGDSEIFDYMSAKALSLGTDLNKSDVTMTFRSAYKGTKISERGKTYEMIKQFEAYGLKNNKHIPEDFIYTSYESRLKLLAGLIDSDGNNSGRNTYSITQTRSCILEGVLEICRLSGFFTNGINEIGVSMKRKDGTVYKSKAYQIEINHSDFEDLNKHMKVERKKVEKNCNRNYFSTSITVNSVGEGEYYGFELDNDPYFLLEDGTVVHNSSKTFSIIQFWILWSYMNRGRKRRVLVSRRKGTWLTATVLNDFLNVLRLYGLYDRKNHNKSTGSGVYTLYDTEFWFIGLDDTQRIHGFESDAFWINEAVEALYDDYAQIMQRCKGFAILDYNPSEEEHWIYDRVLQRPLTFYSHSTMLDNPFIAGTALRQILSYEPTDANYKAGTADERKWKIYGLGQRAKIEGVIFEYKMIPKIPQWVTTSRYGLDFGYTNDVTACADVYFHENNVYIDEMFYKTGMLSRDIVKEFKELPVKKIWCDSADPRLIDEIYNAGINIHPARKPAGSIKAGIDWLKTKNIYITENSLNTKKEFDNYTYQQDKNGMWLNEPIDAHNHIVDGVRYVAYMEFIGKNRPKNNLLQTLY